MKLINLKKKLKFKTIPSERNTYFDTDKRFEYETLFYNNRIRIVRYQTGGNSYYVFIAKISKIYILYLKFFEENWSVLRFINNYPFIINKNLNLTREQIHNKFGIDLTGKYRLEKLNSLIDEE